MGRAMLIIVTGLMVALGYTFMGMTSQKSAMTKRNAKTASEAVTRNLAHNGIQLAIHKLNSSSWSPGKSESITQSLNGGTVEFYWEENSQPKMVDITSTAAFNAATNKIIATIKLGDIVDISQVPGAMGVYGENTEVTIKGNPPEIDGHNYDMDATIASADGHKPGVAGVSTEDATFNLSGNSNSDGDFITGDPRYSHNPELDSQPWNETVTNTYLPNAETYNGDLGSTQAPKVVVIESGSAQANNDGAGILIIKENASFKISGNIKYYGLIIVHGELQLKGTPQIYGSVIFADNSNIDVEDPEGAIKGTPNIRYSEDALNNVNENLQLEGRGATFISIYD